MLKVVQAAFGVACFSGLSEIHECSGHLQMGHLQMAPSPLDKQTAGSDSSHNWFMSLAMDLSALCDMKRWKWHQLIPFDHYQSRRSLYPPLCGYPPTSHPFHPIGVLVVLATPVKTYLKWQAIQLAIHSIAG